MAPRHLTRSTQRNRFMDLHEFRKTRTRMIGGYKASRLLILECYITLSTFLPTLTTTFLLPKTSASLTAHPRIHRQRHLRHSTHTPLLQIRQTRVLHRHAVLPKLPHLVRTQLRVGLPACTFESVYGVRSKSYIGVLEREAGFVFGLGAVAAELNHRDQRALAKILLYDGGKLTSGCVPISSGNSEE
jgi:hypothetical protein